MREHERRRIAEDLRDGLGVNAGFLGDIVRNRRVIAIKYMRKGIDTILRIYRTARVTCVVRGRFVERRRTIRRLSIVAELPQYHRQTCRNNTGSIATARTGFARDLVLRLTAQHAREN